MIRLYARAPRGQRAYAQTLRNYGKNLSLIAALSLDGMGQAMTVEGAVDRFAFESYSREFLAPSLRPGQIVILDNLSVHKGPEVRRLIEGQGCLLLFLPAYSPDLTPIEQAFAKLKAFLRRVGALTLDALQDAIAEGLTLISTTDAAGFFAACGFKPLNHLP
jgi:transposase